MVLMYVVYIINFSTEYIRHYCKLLNRVLIKKVIYTCITFGLHIQELKVSVAIAS